MKKILKYIPSYFFLIISIYFIILILNEINFYTYVINFINALKPFWFGIIITLFLYPFMKDKNNQTSFLRILFVYIIFILLLISIGIIIGLLIYQNSDFILKMINTYSFEMIEIIEKYQLQKYINLDYFQTFVLNSYEWLIPLINKIITYITNFIFSVIISFFISLENQFLINKFKIYVSNYQFYFNVYNIFSNILIKFIVSTFLDIGYILLTTVVLLYFFNTPYGLLLSLILALLNVFPYIGSILGNLLIILCQSIFIKENVLLLSIFLLINSQIESQLIHTWICNKTMKIHPLSLFLSILVGEYLFGVIGIILSPILASIIQMGLLTYHEYLNQKNIGGWEKIIS